MSSQSANNGIDSELTAMATAAAVAATGSSTTEENGNKSSLEANKRALLLNSKSTTDNNNSNSKSSNGKSNHILNNNNSNHNGLKENQKVGKGRTRPLPHFSSGQRDILRLIGQHLRYMGLTLTTDCLISESGCMLEHPMATTFCSLILAGKWPEAEQALVSLRHVISQQQLHRKQKKLNKLENSKKSSRKSYGMSKKALETTITNMKFLILEQKYLEFLEDGKILEALKVLRDELAPLNFNVERLHELSSFLMCGDQCNLKQLSKWQGKCLKSRQILMDKLQSFLPANVMLPPRRLEQLLLQAIEWQCDKCEYHNFKGRGVATSFKEIIEDEQYNEQEEDELCDEYCGEEEEDYLDDDEDLDNEELDGEDEEDLDDDLLMAYCDCGSDCDSQCDQCGGTGGFLNSDLDYEDDDSEEDSDSDEELEDEDFDEEEELDEEEEEDPDFQDFDDIDDDREQLDEDLDDLPNLGQGHQDLDLENQRQTVTFLDEDDQCFQQRRFGRNRAALRRHRVAEEASASSDQNHNPPPSMQTRRRSQRLNHQLQNRLLNQTTPPPNVPSTTTRTTPPSTRLNSLNQKQEKRLRLLKRKNKRQQRLRMLKRKGLKQNEQTTTNSSQQATTSSGLGDNKKVLLRRKRKSPVDNWAFLHDHVCSKEQFPSVSIQCLSDHCDEVWFCKFNNSGTRLATGSKDGCLCIWDVDRRTYRLTLQKSYDEHTCGVGWVSWSPDDRFLIVCGTEECTELWIWDVEQKQLRKRLNNNHDDSLTSAAWLPDGQAFVCGGLKGQFYFCDLDGQVRDTWEGIRVRCLQSLPDGQVLAADSLKRIRMYNFKDINDAHLIQEDFQIMSFTLNKSGSLALISVATQGIHLWDLKDKCLIRRFQGAVQNNYMSFCTFGGLDEQYVASGSEDNKIYIWNIRKETCITTLDGHTRNINCVSWNPTLPGMIASASDDGTVRIWGPSRKLKVSTKLRKQGNSSNRTANGGGNGCNRNNKPKNNNSNDQRNNSNSRTSGGGGGSGNSNSNNEMSSTAFTSLSTVPAPVLLSVPNTGLTQSQQQITTTTVRSDRSTPV